MNTPSLVDRVTGTQSLPSSQIASTNPAYDAQPGPGLLRFQPGPQTPESQPPRSQPRLPGQNPITLEEAKALADQVNPQLARTRETITRAAAEERTVFAEFLPTIGLNEEFDSWSSQIGFAGTPSTRRFPQLPVRGFGPGDQNFQVLDLELRYTLFQFGKRLARHDQAVLRWDIARLQTERARQAVGFEVSLHYAEVLEAYATRAVAERTTERAAEVLRDAVNLEKRGVLTREDVLRAEVQVADARQSLTSAQSGVRIALAALNRAIGITVGFPTRITENALPLPPTNATPEDAVPRPFPLALERCLEVAIENRPEFQVIQQAIRVATRGVDATKADYLPTFGTRTAGSLIDGLDVQNGVVFNAGVYMKWDLYSGGRRVAAVRAAESDVRAAAADAQQMCDTIAYEVHVAFSNIIDARERIAQTVTAVAQARETLRLVQARYNRGDAKPTDVVDAQTALTRAEQNANNARYAYLIALSRMEFATGVPLSALLGMPQPLPPPAFPPPMLPPQRPGGIEGKGP